MVGNACCDGQVAMECHRCDRLVSIFTHRWHHLEVTLLTILHHDVLVEGDLMSGKHLLFATRLLLRVHGRTCPMV